MFNNNYGGFGSNASGGTPPDLSAYWKKNGGSSPASGPWGMGGYNFTNWSGAINQNVGANITLAVVDTPDATNAGEFITKNFFQMFAGNISNTIYASLSLAASGVMNLNSQADETDGEISSSLIFEKISGARLSSQVLSNLMYMDLDPVTGRWRAVSQGDEPGIFGYSPAEGIYFMNQSEVLSTIDNSDVVNETIYKLPNKPSGTEVFAMQSDILLLTLYGLS